MSDKTKRKIADTVDYVMFKTPIFCRSFRICCYRTLDIYDQEVRLLNVMGVYSYTPSFSFKGGKSGSK